MSISTLVQIPLESVQTTSYHKNLAKYGNDSDTCICCGKRVKNYPSCKYVQLLTNGNLISSDQDFDNSQGLFPVGNDCAKKLVVSFAF